MAAAKGAAALTVMAGHFGTGIPNFWVVVTVGLLVFSISSGYFTWQGYHDRFSWGRFWQRKALRLIPHLLVIDGFLLVVFLAQGRQGIWSWYTVVNVIGLNGFLNWLYLPNPSPFGAGMWFLTLLLLFYAAYPLLERCHRRRAVSLAVTLGGVLGFFALQQAVEYGHALWLTAAGFLVGVSLARTRAHVPAVVSALAVVAASVGMAGFHAVFRFDLLNYFFILIIATGEVLLLREVSLPASVTRAGAWLSEVLLEVYLLHPYLRITPTGLRVPDLCLSMAVVLVVAGVLARVARLVEHCSEGLWQPRVSGAPSQEG